MTRSLRQNLMLGIGLSAIAMFAAAGAAVYVLARTSLLAEFDSATHAKARAVASVAEIKDGRIRVDELQEGHMPEFERTSKPEYYQLWSDDGQTLAKSKSLGNAQLDIAPVSDDDAPMTKFLALPDGRPGRQICFRFTVNVEEDEPLGTPQHAIVALARETSHVDLMMARLGGLLLIVSGVATAMMLALSAIVIRRALAPVDQLAARITAIDAHNLSARLPMETASAELSPIVSGLNGLLDRLESVFAREKSFTADAAHELRTPLAGLESALEVCARRERAPEAYASVVADCLDVVRGMHNMIDNLLLLARADANQVQAHPVSVNLNDLLQQGWRRFSQNAALRGLHVVWDVPVDMKAQSDPEKLLHVFTNVFENAVRYVNPGGTIRVNAMSEDGSVIVSIANTGSRVPPDDAGRVFERFWRGDPARTEIGIHCGLGLSVCRNMMAVLHGSIAASSELDGEFVVQITMPASALHCDFMVAV